MVGHVTESNVGDESNVSFLRNLSVFIEFSQACAGRRSEVPRCVKLGAVPKRVEVVSFQSYALSVCDLVHRAC